MIFVNGVPLDSIQAAKYLKRFEIEANVLVFRWSVCYIVYCLEMSGLL